MTYYGFKYKYFIDKYKYTQYMGRRFRNFAVVVAVDTVRMWYGIYMIFCNNDYVICYAHRYGEVYDVRIVNYDSCNGLLQQEYNCTTYVHKNPFFEKLWHTYIQWIEFAITLLYDLFIFPDKESFEICVSLLLAFSKYIYIWYVYDITMNKYIHR